MCSENDSPISTFYGLLDLVLDFRSMRAARYRKGHATQHLVRQRFVRLHLYGLCCSGYVLGALLVVFLAARWEWFPTGGFVGDHHESTPVQSVSVQAGSDRWSAPDHKLQNGDEVWFETEPPAAIPKLESQAGYWAEVLDADHFRLHPAEGAPAIQLQTTAKGVPLMRHTSLWAKMRDSALASCSTSIGLLHGGQLRFVTMLMKNHLSDNPPRTTCA